nr:hypothetical protein [Tanacetum cinerariifolium]
MDHGCCGGGVTVVMMTLGYWWRGGGRFMVRCGRDGGEGNSDGCMGWCGVDEIDCMPAGECMASVVAYLVTAGYDDKGVMVRRLTGGDGDETMMVVVLLAERAADGVGDKEGEMVV